MSDIAYEWDTFATKWTAISTGSGFFYIYEKSSPEFPQAKLIPTCLPSMGGGVKRAVGMVIQGSSFLTWANHVQGPFKEQ